MPPFHPIRILPHRSQGIIRSNPWPRSYHTAIAKFTTIDPKGIPVSYNTGIMIGEPKESYVYIEPEIGNAIQLAILRQLGPNATSRFKTLALQFHHDSHHFAHESVPLPRVDIFRNLGRSSCHRDTSPATLWLSGNWHAMTLDGTPDGEYQVKWRDDKRGVEKMQNVLVNLEDREFRADVEGKRLRAQRRT